MYTLERKVGRLFEMRVEGTGDRDGMRAFQHRIIEIVPTLGRDEKFVLITDLRTAGVLPADLAAEMLVMMRATHARLERAAVLIGPGDSARLLQTRRMIEEAHFEARKLFTDRREASAYLAPALTAAESARLEKFFDEWRPKT